MTHTDYTKNILNIKDENIYFYEKCLVKIPKVSNFNTILLLDKQRFYRKHCHSTFTARTSLVDFHKQISNNTKLSIILDLINKGSEKDISIRNNVSTNSTNRILDEISNDTIVKNNGLLPEILGIDEFNATRDTISKMAFIIVDQTNKNILKTIPKKKEIRLNSLLWIYINLIIN